MPTAGCRVEMGGFPGLHADPALCMAGRLDSVNLRQKGQPKHFNIGENFDFESCPIEDGDRTAIGRWEIRRRQGYGGQVGVGNLPRGTRG